MSAEVLRDGWYTTGDIAMMEEDGLTNSARSQLRDCKFISGAIPRRRSAWNKPGK
jgi:acyl-CoA synthetase (AMP-forming)/AMP-acid ligase II